MYSMYFAFISLSAVKYGTIKKIYDFYMNEKKR